MHHSFLREERLDSCDFFFLDYSRSFGCHHCHALVILASSFARCDREAIFHAYAFPPHISQTFERPDVTKIMKEVNWREFVSILHYIQFRTIQAVKRNMLNFVYYYYGSLLLAHYEFHFVPSATISFTHSSIFPARLPQNDCLWYLAAARQWVVNVISICWTRSMFWRGNLHPTHPVSVLYMILP